MASVLRLQHTSIPMPPNGHDRARGFFGAALGMEEIPPPTGLNPGRLVWFRAGPDGQEVHCFVDEQPEPRSNQQHLCLQVDDVDAFRKRLTEHGVAIQESDAIVNRPRFFVHDPFGNLIELAQITGDYT
jgi:catechol 2,3-dioxygenase-like lactoylglutathione lyase family enzyme